VPGARCYLLTAPGCKTGWPRPNPVVPVEHDGRRWLMAPYGPVSWVHNARATERVRLARRRGTRDYVIWEVPPEEAWPVSSASSATRPYFAASEDSPLKDFAAEADRHPAFELIPGRR
jgi:deazaflavin-dependent oxidoreductase (nitroreductase family)